MQATVDRKKLFCASCLAPPVISLFLAMPASNANQAGTDLGLNVLQAGTIAGTCCGFTFAMIIGRMIGDARESKGVLVSLKNKSTKLNHFQFSGLIVIGLLLVYLYIKAPFESIGVIPIILTIAFTDFVLYMHGTKEAPQ